MTLSWKRARNKKSLNREDSRIQFESREARCFFVLACQLIPAANARLCIFSLIPFFSFSILSP